MRNKLFAILLVAASVVLLTACDSGDYKKATNLYNSGQFKEAADLFESLGDYEDSADMLLICRYEEANQLMNEGKYEDAAAIYESIIGYSDAADKLAEANSKITYEKYGDVIDLLAKEAFYYNGGSSNQLNRIIFTESGATIEKVYFDGNGKWDNGSDSVRYTMDDSVISVTQADGSLLEIPYKVEGDSVKLGNGEYLTLAEIDRGIQGYWSLTTYTFGKQEYHIYFENGTVKSENAARSLFNSDEYFYYGPYEGTYTLDFGSFNTDMDHGNDWFFTIIDGKPTILHYDSIASPGGSFPGQYGYSL